MPMHYNLVCTSFQTSTTPRDILSVWCATQREALRTLEQEQQRGWETVSLSPTREVCSLSGGLTLLAFGVMQGRREP